MTSTRSPYSNLAGARLPSGGPTAVVADPANGETVPRCHTCGMPDAPDAALLDFELRLGGRPAGRYTLCERCHRRRNPPPTAADADPLYVAGRP